MAIDLLKDRATPLDNQKFTWKELTQPPSQVRAWLAAAQNREVA
jgi:hypothetical protein